MKEPEKVGENQLEEGVTLWGPQDFKAAIEAGKPVRSRIVEIHCPYCAAGRGTTVVEGPDVIGPGDEQKADMKPKECDSCHHWFRVGMRIQYIGIRMEG